MVSTWLGFRTSFSTIAPALFYLRPSVGSYLLHPWSRPGGRGDYQSGRLGTLFVPTRAFGGLTGGHYVPTLLGSQTLESNQNKGESGVADRLSNML
jgi:hypothetical protein